MALTLMGTVLLLEALRLALTRGPLPAPTTITTCFTGCPPGVGDPLSNRAWYTASS